MAGGGDAAEGRHSRKRAWRATVSGRCECSGRYGLGQRDGGLIELQAGERFAGDSGSGEREGRHRKHQGGEGSGHDWVQVSKEHRRECLARMPGPQ